jgi:hypothetical protein
MLSAPPGIARVRGCAVLVGEGLATLTRAIRARTGVDVELANMPVHVVLGAELDQAVGALVHLVPVQIAHVRRQVARLPERFFAVRARVVSALLVYRAHMRLQIARLPERFFALRARVLSALLMHHAHMPRQMARLPERFFALRALVVSALLVHRAHMPPQIADVPGLVGALRARVSARLRKLLHHPVAGERVPRKRGIFLENQQSSAGNCGTSCRQDLTGL